MSGSIRVAFVLQDTGFVYGAERATLDLAHGLRVHTPIELAFVLIRETRLGLRHSGIEDELKMAGIRYSCVSTGHAFSLRLVQRLRAAFDRCEADCVHAIGYKAVFHCALAALPPGSRPWISTIHGWLERKNVRERLYKRLEIRALKRANKVIALSTYYRNLLSSYGFSEGQLDLIPSGIDIEDWTPTELSTTDSAKDGRICIGIIGRLSEEKNHRMFLRVAELLLKEGLLLRFLIAGDGPLKQQLAQHIQSRKLGEHISMPGMMEREAFFGQCDILVSCSRIENLPYSIMEAMACSMPVVATAVGGVPDLVCEELTGSLVAVDDDEAMASRLRQLIHDPERARILGSAARCHIKEGFSLARSADLHFGLYEDVVRRKTPAIPCKASSK